METSEFRTGQRAGLDWILAKTDEMSPHCQVAISPERKQDAVATAPAVGVIRSPWALDCARRAQFIPLLLAEGLPLSEPGRSYFPALWNMSERVICPFLVEAVRATALFMSFSFPLTMSHQPCVKMVTSKDGGALGPHVTDLSTATCWPTLDRWPEETWTSVVFKPWSFGGYFLLQQNLACPGCLRDFPMNALLLTLELQFTSSLVNRGKQIFHHKKCLALPIHAHLSQASRGRR